MVYPRVAEMYPDFSQSLNQYVMQNQLLTEKEIQYKANTEKTIVKCRAL